MSCHFQISIEPSQSKPFHDEESCQFLIRMRKDGHQVHSTFVDMGELGILQARENQYVEDILWFALPANQDIRGEDEWTQFGWCLVQSPEFTKEIAEFPSGDLLSVNSERLDATNPKQLFKHAVKRGETLQQQNSLQDQTPPVEHSPKRPRF